MDFLEAAGAFQVAINDNDFGVANITVNPDGTFTLNYVPEREQLGLIHVRHNGLDASDNDSKINIRPWPVKGLYLPDAIASYKVGNETFLVTANEGDVREWGPYAELVRIGSGSVVAAPFQLPSLVSACTTLACGSVRPVFSPRATGTSTTPLV